jgi:tRNA ligase
MVGQLFKSFASKFRSLLVINPIATTAMAPQYTPEDSALIADLHKLSTNDPKLVKSATYVVPGTDIMLCSWKMNEFKYYDVPSPFPTLAVGLFTTELPIQGEGAEKMYRIVVRGYDKFFNIGEIPWTNVSSSLTPY